ncbi:hypothetical protein LWF15_15335 [Kineosporia rhizophila]|uniref:hypothetical protein n=1 Tax=Kineosporia TaxID=49184 RepID=UPI001E32118A|nr:MULTISPECIES: hypothetical protein [Kineosporia]MCE0536877.1 hypothetical protein [Kineosporia rhizophila]GLY19032.1 hypothetical protein Kisp01_60460 [Kineosporia sp. NBRC 101677]
MSAGALRGLRAAAAVEALSLVMLLLNLATVHVAALASALGPIHGCAYLIAVVLTWTITKEKTTRAFSIVPGFGALLALRRLEAADA